MKTQIKLTKKEKQTIKKYALEIGKAFIYIALTLAAALLSSCGITKATISKPAAGTVTTVTITTANPMTTQVTPNTNFDYKKGEQQ